MSVVILNVTQGKATFMEAQTPEQVADALRIPVIAEIEPQPDPVYGHTFQWPAEVAQFLADQP